MGYFVKMQCNLISELFFPGYTTDRPAEFKLQDDGSIQAINALTAVYGSSTL